MKNKVMCGLILIVISINSIFLVYAVSDKDVKNVLRKALLEYFENPANTTLNLPETKDLLNFYLTAQKGQDTVDLSQTGSNSRKSIQTIFSKAFLKYEEGVCYTLYDPVCGSDGRTYSNDCYAQKANVIIACQGECPCEVCNPTSRESNKYCGSDGRWHIQKTTDASCSNNYECISNNCENKKCEEYCYPLYEPVCGSDGKTYSNDCYAKKANVIIACQGECPCEIKEAYFKFTEGIDNFTFKLTKSIRIQQARDILGGKETNAIHVMGVIVKEKVGYNPQWSYHLEPSSIEFFENAVEVCDAGIQYVEDHLEEVCGSFLPYCQWCPWGSKLIEEVHMPVYLGCTDSDVTDEYPDGKNYYKKGNCIDNTESAEKGPLWDYCYTDGKTLAEMYCERGNCVSFSYKCPYGCKDGACIRSDITNLDITVATLKDSYSVNEQIELTDPPEITNSKVSVLSFQSGWPKSTDGPTYSSPAIADIDNDGDLELVIGSTDNKVYAWHHDGSLVNGWPQVTGGGVYASPAIADIDNDGDLEIFVGSFDAKMYAWHHDGSLVNGWPYQTNYTLSGVVIIRTNFGNCYNTKGCNNGKCDVEVFDENGCTDSDGNWNYFTRGTANDGKTTGTDYCDGNKIIEYGCSLVDYKVDQKSYDCPYNCTNGACNLNPGQNPVYDCTDTDGGNNQFLQGSTFLEGGPVYTDYCSSTGYVEYHCDISKVTPQTYYGEILSSPTIGDIDNDGDLEIAVGIKDIPGKQLDGREGNNQFYVWHHDGTLMQGWPKTIPSPETGFTSEVYSTPSLADLDNDGDLEIISGNNGFYIYAWHHDGNDVTGWPQYIGRRPIKRQAVIGDLDNDGEYEIVAIAGYSWPPNVTSNSVIHVYNTDGTELPGFPLELPARINGIPVIADIDNDNDLEIVVAVGTGGASLFVWHHDGSLAWTKELIDAGGERYNSANGAIIFDIDNDNDMEILIGGYSEIIPCVDTYGKIFGWHHDGSEILDFPLDSEGVYWSGISVNDLDLDGDIEISFGTDHCVGGGTKYGNVFVYDLQGLYKKENIEWGKGYHDLQNTGLYDVVSRSKSMINNRGTTDVRTTDVTGQLVMKVQKIIGGEWQDYLKVVNQEATVPANSYLALDKIWNPYDVKVREAGEYRVYASFEVGGQEIKATYEFSVVE